MRTCVGLRVRSIWHAGTPRVASAPVTAATHVLRAPNKAALPDGLIKALQLKVFVA